MFCFPNESINSSQKFFSSIALSIYFYIHSAARCVLFSFYFIFIVIWTFILKFMQQNVRKSFVVVFFFPCTVHIKYLFVLFRFTVILNYIMNKTCTFDKMFTMHMDMAIQIHLLLHTHMHRKTMPHGPNKIKRWMLMFL